MNKKKTVAKTVFARPTEPMRWVPADEERPFPVDPAHDKAIVAGWSRLCEILNEAMQDKRIAGAVGLGAGGPQDFLELMLDLAEIAQSNSASDSVQALKPLTKSMAADQLRAHSGHKQGGKTMAARKNRHQESLKNDVEAILRNPKTSGWSNPDIARWLMKPERARHESEGTALGEQTMTNRVKKIREEFISSK